MAQMVDQPTKLNLSNARTLFAKTWANWNNDAVPRLAAAFAFYAILSLAPLLVFAVVGAAYFYGRSLDTEHALLEQVRGAAGEQVGALIKQMIESSKQSSSGVLATIFSLVVTFFSASNLFLQLNDTTNAIWGIRAKGSAFRNFIISRLAAFVGVLVFGAVVVAWLGLDSWLGWMGRNYGGVSGWKVCSFAAFVVLLFGLCALAFKSNPRDRLQWSDVIPGALFSAVGIGVTKLLLSLYFANFHVAAAYGSAGALVVVLLWIYYTSQIFFFGAEITYTYSHEFGSRINVDESGLQVS